MSVGLNPEQARATDPFAHAALSASAGTGKTHVLTSRVFRLLLNGVDPQTILCLTFTKAGASAIAERIGERLAHWVRLSGPELAGELEALGEDTGPATRAEAQRLFARVLDAPGGIRIQTIHGFAQSLLAAFPAEAGVTPGFKPIEGRAADELTMRVLADMMTDAEAQGEDGLLADVAVLSKRLGERGAIDYLKRCAAHVEAFEEVNPATIEGRLRAIMGLPDCDVDKLLAERCGDDQFDCDLLRAIAEANRSWATATGTGLAEKVEAWLAMTPAERSVTLPELALVVFTGSGDLRKVSAGQRKADPAYDDKSEALAAAVSELLALQNGCALAADMAAGVRAGRAFAIRYARAKRALGVADFNDLIRWARKLLDDRSMADWVRYKLDQRVDHLLVDEAQDTNADQWSIIAALIDEFFHGGDEAEDRHRTLLMVGDFKQAIFGFQGTDPREFERVRQSYVERARALREAADQADRPITVRDFHDLAMATSFRSAQGVLDAVDAMIAVVGHEAMGLPRPPERHRAATQNRNLPAAVEWWPPFAPVGDDNVNGDEEGWMDLRERRYASAIAQEVRQRLDRGEVLGSTGRPIQPGDIMILVRSRGELASLIVARLFEAGVPVAGIDRLHLHEPLAVQDLLAAMRFAVQPLDDLNLANLLVSPLLGWSQDDLLELAQPRKGSLWSALRDRQAERASWSEAYSALLGLLAMADYTAPSQYLETILSGPLNGRIRLAGRLGLASSDPVDELLSSALQFERDELPSIEQFLAWFGRGDVEIARDSSMPSNEVRVMTVHGAKGLEAPMVIIADAHSDPARQGRQNLPFDAELESLKLPLVRPRKSELVEPFAGMIAAAQNAALEEHWRLFYVGLTRAIDHVVVAGLEPARGELAANSWLATMREAMDRLGSATERRLPWGDVRIYRQEGKPSAAKLFTEDKAALAAVPQWARSQAPIEQRPPRPLAPSAIGKDDVVAPPPTPGMRAAAERGILIHALLERLAGVAPELREGAALAWLERSAQVNDRELAREIAETVCGILTDSRYASLFGPQSIGEAPLAATLPDGSVIAGTVDRLLVEDEMVSVIDFKTGRVPVDDALIPAAHRAQMLAYRQALAVIFPDRPVRTALLYTGGPVMFELGA